jgi:protein-tyrosine-phosphatase
MAEAFARMHGGRTIDAYSAGPNPSGRINPRAIRAMKEKGYDLRLHLSKSFEDLPDVKWDLIVTVGNGDEYSLPRAKRFERWHIPDPVNMSPEEFRRVRDQIEGKVKELFSAR